MTAKGRPEGIRIIAGSLRGKSIRVPAGWHVRPMRTRIRQALFNSLGDAIIACRFLDVFAGSGSIAIEALSRGAREAVLVETDPGVISVLAENLQKLSLGRRSRILAIDPYGELPPEDPFDIAFLDPPFPYFWDGPDPWPLVSRLVAAGWVKEGGKIGVECPGKIDAPDLGPGLETVRDRRYGDTRMVMFEVRGSGGLAP